ncbi:hypothetical protein LWC05_16510 [Acetobacter sicerae]|uniref:Minor tail protein n=1 Tax=Acetobacter sicerae TaxID=85325 RepID=A0ABS8W1F6_9PROT|nr:hypothetical protein [Acetobacter sicerae]MCE0745475.1 hypothetical protein [Acetobacter sicerae]
MADWLILARESGHALLAAAGVLSGWWAHSYRMRSIARQEVYDAGQMALEMVRRSAAREASLTELVHSYESELIELRRARWQTMDVLSAVQVHALAARLIVRELDARLGLPRRQFEPLPSFPDEPESNVAEEKKAE